MTGRAFSIDALRGYAIITMVLSATVVMGILPGWMYHAQLPPPSHAFNPDVPGLTWVDMVFPSFLFAMGAAFPFSIGKKYRDGVSKLRLAGNALWRGVLLTYFAILIQHFYPYMTGGDTGSQWLALFCFALLFVIYMRLPGRISSRVRLAIQIAAMAAGVIVALSIDYPGERTFDLHTSNIIILILANMAVFASLLYIFTIDRPVLRIAVMALLFGAFLSASVSGSWTNDALGYSPVTWFYNPAYLKYLYIVIPGAFAGEILWKWMAERKNATGVSTSRVQAWAMIAITLAVIVTNLYCLYMRYMVLNMAVTAALAVAGWCVLRRASDFGTLWKKLFVAGAFMLVLGLLTEAFEGGIKKDPVTFSYLFTTSGLSFMALIFFSVVCDYFRCHRGTAFLVMSGQNPMLAYVADNMFIFPVLQLCGLWKCLEVFGQSPWLGFLQGVVLTSLVVLVTMFFTKIKWLWRT